MLSFKEGTLYTSRNFLSGSAASCLTSSGPQFSHLQCEGVGLNNPLLSIPALKSYALSEVLCLTECIAFPL